MGNSRSKTIVELEARLITETSLARKFEFEAGEVWLPKETHEWDPEENIVSLRENLAIEKGLV